MILGIDASQANREIKSGTEWYAFYLIQEFKKFLAGRNDIRIRLYTRDSLEQDLAASLPENFEVRILHWPFKYFWGQIRLSWEMFINPPDVLFCPAHTIPVIHPHPTSPIKGEEILKNSPPSVEGVRGGGKIFTTLHDVGFEDYPELYDRLSLWYHKFSARLAVRKAYHIFTVSEFSKKRIIENYGCPENKLTVTYLGIDQDFSIEKSWSIGKKYALREKNYFLFIGRLEPKKNILNMIKAFEMANIDQDFVLAGREIDISDVKEYLKDRSKLRQKIKFFGYVSEEEKINLYRGASIFLFATLYEGFGLPIIEAQACGVPIIISNTASNPEIAGGGAVVVDPRSPREIAAAIKKLREDENFCREKIMAGFENIKRFSWENTARQTLKVIGIID